MFSLGSYDNPYSKDQFNILKNSGEWRGGWVQSPFELSYYTKNSTQYRGDMKRGYPVPYVIYEEMLSRGYWDGGWVGTSSSPNYYSKSGTPFSADFGSQNSPWPFYIYQEMTQNGKWESGWVEFDDGTIKYLQELATLEGSGNAGSGSTSSSSIDASGIDYGTGDTLGYKVRGGQGIIGTIKNGAFQLEVGWSEGNTFGHIEMSDLTISLKVLNSSYQIVDSSFRATWSDPYTATFYGDFSYEKDKEIRHCYICNGSITIPDSYHVGSDE